MKKASVLRTATCCVVLLFITCISAPSNAQAQAANSCLTTIDLLFVYTAPVLKKSPGANPKEKLANLTKKLQGEVDGLNDILGRSAVPIHVRIVGVKPTSISETKVKTKKGNKTFPSMKTYLKRVTHAKDVEKTRYCLRADLVTLVVLNRTGPNGIAHHWDALWMNFNTRAFSVLKYRSIKGDGKLIAHEFGHNLGCGHNWGDLGGLTFFPFSRGWVMRYGKKKYCTVMSSDKECIGSVLHFSNPRVKAAPTGETSKKRTGHWLCADNARSLCIVRGRVARWGDTLPPPKK